MTDNILSLITVDIDIFSVIAVMFGVVSLFGLIFFSVLRYHFKRFNLPHDTKGFLILWWCSAMYLVLLIIGVGIIVSVNVA